jgi:hypothetical protein
LSSDLLSQSERDFAIKSLEDSRRQFVEVTAHRSIAEIAEHIALSEDKLFQDAVESLKKRDPDPGSRKPTDEAVMKFMTDRTIKAQAPDYLQPGRTLSSAAIVERFARSRERNVAYIRTTKDDLRHHYTVGPLGSMDASQTIIGMSGHCEKHVGQMRDVIAAPGFPHK